MILYGRIRNDGELIITALQPGSSVPAHVTPEIAAAITGAIAAALKTDSTQFAVQAVRPVPDRLNNWLYAGRKLITEKSYELALLRRGSRR